MKRTRILSISDLHFGSSRIDPECLADNFCKYVLPHFGETDLLLVEGDFFDTALGLSDAPTPSVLSIMFMLLTEAAKHDIVVRFLRGTFSHERTQCQYFPILHKQYAFTNDLKYYDTIALEYIERFDMRILYLPDDLPYPNSDAVLRVVHQKLQELGWTYVDYAAVHGYFDHVVPVGAVRPKNTYERSQFDFVKRYVLIGHVHTPSISDKFIYNGSFDRSGHGEEEPKGFVTLDDDGTTARVRFVPNPDATVFITLDYTDVLDEDVAMQNFLGSVQGYPKNKIAHVRVKHPNAAWRQGLDKFVKQNFPHIRLLVRASKPDSAEDSLPHTQIVDFTTYVKPTPETLPSLVIEHGDPLTKPASLTEDRIRDLLVIASTP